MNDGKESKAAHRGVAASTKKVQGSNSKVAVDGVACVRVRLGLITISL